MPRPKKATADFFPHFVGHGKTLFNIEADFGNDGYAFWFKLLELLGQSEHHYYDCNKPKEWRYLLSKTRFSEENAICILDMLAELEAIDGELWEHKIIWSQNFIDNLAELYSRRSVNPYTKEEIKDLCTPKTPVNGINDNNNPHSRVEDSIEENSRRTPPKSPPVDRESINDIDNDGYKRIVKAFNNNIHPITPFEAEGLTEWLIDGVEPELVIWAIKQAVINGIRTARYIDAIIRNLFNNGITTLAGAEARERDREDAKRYTGEKARESPKQTPEQKERIKELNRLIAEKNSVNNNLSKEVPP